VRIRGLSPRGIGSHLRNHIVGYVAVFLAVSGVAMAAQVAPKNSVATKSLKNGAVTGAKLAANSVTGDKVADGSLGPQDITIGDQSIGRSATHVGLTCDPNTTTDCGSVQIDVPRPSRVLVIADANAQGASGEGSCGLADNGTQITFGSDAVHTGDSFTLNTVTDPVSGNHSFGLICGESSSDLRIANVHISAVTLSPN